MSESQVSWYASSFQEMGPVYLFNDLFSLPYSFYHQQDMPDIEHGTMSQQPLLQGTCRTLVNAPQWAQHGIVNSMIYITGRHLDHHLYEDPLDHNYVDSYHDTSTSFDDSSYYPQMGINLLDIYQSKTPMSHQVPSQLVHPEDYIILVTNEELPTLKAAECIFDRPSSGNSHISITKLGAHDIVAGKTENGTYYAQNTLETLRVTILPQVEQNNYIDNVITCNPINMNSHLITNGAITRDAIRIFTPFIKNTRLFTTNTHHHCNTTHGLFISDFNIPTGIVAKGEMQICISHDVNIQSPYYHYLHTHSKSESEITNVFIRNIVPTSIHMSLNPIANIFIASPTNSSTCSDLLYSIVNVCASQHITNSSDTVSVDNTFKQITWVFHQITKGLYPTSELPLGTNMCNYLLRHNMSNNKFLCDTPHFSDHLGGEVDLHQYAQQHPEFEKLLVAIAPDVIHILEQQHHQKYDAATLIQYIKSANWSLQGDICMRSGNQTTCTKLLQQPRPTISQSSIQIIRSLGNAAIIIMTTYIITAIIYMLRYIYLSKHSNTSDTSEQGRMIELNTLRTHATNTYTTY